MRVDSLFISEGSKQTSINLLEHTLLKGSKHDRWCCCKSREGSLQMF